MVIDRFEQTNKQKQRNETPFFVRNFITKQQKYVTENHGVFLQAAYEMCTFIMIPRENEWKLLIRTKIDCTSITTKAFV